MVRLPLADLDLVRRRNERSTRPAKTFTCLILHEEKNRKNGATAKISIGADDAAKLNLKISEQEERLHEMSLKMKVWNLD